MWLVLNKLWLMAILHCLVAGCGSGLRLNDGFDMKFKVIGCSLILIVLAESAVVYLVLFFRPGFQCCYF